MRSSSIDEQFVPSPGVSPGTEILNERKNKFFSAYMTKARLRMKININRETVAQIVG